MAFGQPNPGFLANMSGFLSGMGAQPPQPPMAPQAPPMAQAAQPPVAPIAQAVQAQQHHGINWLGVLADALSGAAGQPGMYAQSMLKQKDETRQNDRELQRQKDLYQYEVDHSKPTAPGEFEATLIQSGIQPGTPEWTQAMITRRQNMLDPVVMSPQGPMTRSQLLGGGGTPAPAGVTFTPVDGGQTPPASGGFPRYQ